MNSKIIKGEKQTEKKRKPCDKILNIYIINNVYKKQQNKPV